MTKLTRRQQEILSLIESHMTATGSPPTRAEIAKTMGFRSPNAAEDHLRALARKGVIELVPGTSRGIRLTKPVGGMPVVKSIGLSGQPLFSEHHIVGTCKFDRSFFQLATDYLLHITHKSMPDCGIQEGDYLAIHKTHDIQSGQLVLLTLNHDIQVRRYTPDLQSQRNTIEGIVAGIIRAVSPLALS